MLHLSEKQVSIVSSKSGWVKQSEHILPKSAFIELPYWRQHFVGVYNYNASRDVSFFKGNLSIATYCAMHFYFFGSFS